MLTLDELRIPPTDSEVSDVIELLTLAGSDCAKHVETIRRLAFQRDMLLVKQYEDRVKSNGVELKDENDENIS